MSALAMICCTSLTLSGAAHAKGEQDLSSTIAAALSHAPSLSEARANEAEAKAKLDAARAEGHPQIGIDGSYGAGRIDNGGFFGIAAANTNPESLRALGELPLYAGGRIKAAIAGAQSMVALARDSGESTRLSVTVQAVSAYTDVLSSRLLDARYHKLVDELTLVEHQADLRFQAGDIPQSDLAAAKARLAEGEGGLAEAEGRRISAEAHFERLTGEHPGELAALPKPPVLPASLDEATDRAHNANPALKRARDALAAAQANRRAAHAESLPTIGAFAEASRDRDEFVAGYRSDAYTVGVRGHWTLWAGGRTKAKIHAADAEIDASEAREQEASQAIDGAVIDAWQAFHTAQRMLDASDLRATASEEALRSTRLEAKVGEKPLIAVLDAEREAMNAEVAKIDAEGQRLLAGWQIKALVGDGTP